MFQSTTEEIMSEFAFWKKNKEIVYFYWKNELVIEKFENYEMSNAAKSS